MSDFNKVILMGRLTQKPELRYTTGGDPVATLNVASSYQYRSRDGEDREDTCFVDVVVWRRQAETCTEYLVKGQRVLVEGRLTLRRWETAQGEKRRTYEIQASRVIFLEKPRGAAAEAPPPAELEEEEGEDVPF
ncbi:MAG: single-stranded DNA-binding protein [Candidatus Hydrogenedentota bacterium]|nr:MAG: single-stranded DNA-binding protein [Candidatus Hydrogenedentota bacterium]